MPTFSMKLTQPEYDAVKRRAELRGVPMSQVIKDRMFGRLDEPKHEPVPREPVTRAAHDSPSSATRLAQVEPRPKKGKG